MFESIINTTTSLEMKEKKTDKPKKPKKPNFIKKVDLDIEGYKKELRDRDPSYLVKTAWQTVLTSRNIKIYLVLQIAAAWAGYGQLALCTGLLWLMYVNTGTRTGGKSAYSLFNEGVEGIAGSTDMEAVERELRHRQV